jgi:hypothetical protein
VLSHNEHLDNPDHEGRRFALSAPLIVTHPRAVGRLGPPAKRAISKPEWRSPEIPHPQVLTIPLVDNALGEDADVQQNHHYGGEMDSHFS